MLKSDLVNILVQKKGVTQKQAEATVDVIFN
ncbi:MAG: integration host factor subunit beta, partial [Archangium sp.]|nr:integration host factor subunit beta [Archangium sp.]